MTDEMREGIKNSVRAQFNFLAGEPDKRHAYALCYAFGYGVQVGSQDAELTNFVNNLLAKYRLKLVDGEA